MIKTGLITTVSTEAVSLKPGARSPAGIKGLLFDKDGTLLDYFKTWVPINREVTAYAAQGNQALQRRMLTAGGHDPDTDHVAAGSILAGGSMDVIVDMLRREAGDSAPTDLHDTVARMFAEGGARSSVLIDGARVAARVLRERGYRMGIATNDTIAGLNASLNTHDILSSFEFTCGCDSGFGGKPGPGMVFGFCKAVGLAPHEIAVIGDSIHDLEMGHAAGAGLGVGVLSGTAGHEHLGPHADMILCSVEDMLACFPGVVD
jgi:phosphoglycolate phosphatase